LIKILSDKNERALISYTLQGYTNNDINNSARVEGRADMIELGIPCSDPIADGPIIRGIVSLSSGRTTPQTCLKTGKIMTNIELPNLIIKYLNIIFKSGLKNFIKKSVESGIDCFIVPDISIEESDEYMVEDKFKTCNNIFGISQYK
jgi:tryptophan synthase alpha chain